MEKIYSVFTSVFTFFLIVLSLNGCGKKDSKIETGASDSKKEETKKEKIVDDSRTAGEVSKENESSGIANSDKMIDEYQEIVDQYVKIVKEMKNGNMSNIKDLQELATKTQEWSVKLSKIAPSLTEAQQKRLEKISKEAEMYLK